MTENLATIQNFVIIFWVNVTYSFIFSFSALAREIARIKLFQILAAFRFSYFRAPISLPNSSAGTSFEMMERTAMNDVPFTISTKEPETERENRAVNHQVNMMHIQKNLFQKEGIQDLREHLFKFQIISRKSLQSSYRQILIWNLQTKSQLSYKLSQNCVSNSS